MNRYFLHAITSAMNSVKSMLLYLLPETREKEQLLYKYDGIAEEIAEAVAEINETERRTRK